MSIGSVWFPDCIARWYDDFSDGYPYSELDQWGLRGAPVRNGSWKQRLIEDPHKTAKELDDFITCKSSPSTEEERRFQTLSLASDVFHEMGFRISRHGGEPAWELLRRHWRKTGNLLRACEGYLLPREVRPQEWAWNPGRPRHTINGLFPYFVRSRPSDYGNLRIRVTVLPPKSVPSVRQLRVAVVPLVDSIGDFELTTDDSDLNYPRFSMSLRSPDVVERAALTALEQSAKEGCDIVVFPELCLTPAIQESLGEALRKLGADRPQLVIAGSARTQLAGPKIAHHNRAVVFDSFGKLVLSHHKLHRYVLDPRQQDRYGISEAFGHIDRKEDMETSPYELEILDTVLGRLAVLICEDLVVEDFVTPLITKLGLDWLFVPVFDGCQMKSRWPAQFGRKYAEKGACVVVATSLSLVRQHLLRLASPVPPSGVGVLILPSAWEPETELFVSSVHDQPVILSIPLPPKPHA